ncbi:hypothetical protein MKZ38_010747 [Zalerion maritima]|uniref:SRP9 domain-containing protein n=1 Tax=Zalerion maritima TaxID=339359 RepID=A0AAD5RXZ5_9PEZI|nr:hypothetical protein MKZ38_010747 [Zalerion maritima]
MVFIETSQEWLQRSAQLIESKPLSTRTTTKYSISPPRAKSTPEPSSTAASKVTKRSTAPRASIELKTYDPVSGTALKYRTTKAAEVSRLILALGTLGRDMAALPKEEEQEGEDTAMVEAPDAAGEDGEKDAVGKGGKGEAPKESGSAPGGGKKKKKKGKK